ncbi:unnamed protein product [Zymoseptoria tritici ST99CH_3D7]|uniref:Ran-binding-domain-containing protein n=1 Tax=Zymoseptoria tritici (strain ST99CH_3D7) TaxID=1276538 RepID=A0A1X7RQE9_ZYMT9|nr:unnamed protein product [Zymoseptoria tritici ST99CH_3D7]
MDELLSRVTQQAVQYAIRSGITITTGYAIKSAARLLKEAPRGKEREELMELQLRLESKIKVISPSIDMIELIAARGNTSLESAVSLTKDIRYELQKLGVRLNAAAEEEALLRRKSSKAKTRNETDHELRAIIAQVKRVLNRIEDAVPLINLAITTSGVNLSTQLSGSISPSRLLQSSTFLTAADHSYNTSPTDRQQVGPTYILTMYMLFAGHVRPVDEHGVRETTWKEVIHMARVKLWRIPIDQMYALPGETDQQDAPVNIMPGEAKASEYAYQLGIVEDLDDDRMHTFEDGEAQPGSFDDVANAGIRDIVPIHEISKIFYADTGKILNIGSDGDAYSPVLLLKRDVHAEPPRKMLDRSESRASFFPENSVNGHEEELSDQFHIDAQFDRESTPIAHTQDPPPFDSSSWRLPPDLDPEWMAFEVYTEDASSSTSSPSSSPPTSRPTSSHESDLHNRLTDLSLHESPKKMSQPTIKTSLSLLELLLKLTALQQFQQQSHLSIPDELLNFFLSDSATAGSGADKNLRQKVRLDATRRVGFDPYDESPVKRRTEEYIGGFQDGVESAHGSRQGTPAGNGNGADHLEAGQDQTWEDLLSQRLSASTRASASPGSVRPSIERIESERRRKFGQTPERSPPANMQATPKSGGPTSAHLATPPSLGPTPSKGRAQVLGNGEKKERIGSPLRGSVIE